MTKAPDLDARMRDLAAVMDAAGSQRAALVGHSEGGPTSVLFVAAHPERTEALVLYGAMARSTYSEDHPWLRDVADLQQSGAELLRPAWGTGVVIDVSAPSNLEVRIGLHSGEIEIIGDDVGGVAVHIAARVAAHAAGGEVLASRTVKDLVAGSGITFESRGSHALKGIPDEWEIVAVTS